MGKAKAPPFKASATPSLALLLNPLAWLLWILDFLLWFALFGWVKTLKQRVAKKYGSYRAMGTRTFLGDYKPEGAKFPLKKFGETTWITFQELHDRSTPGAASSTSPWA
ncbi:decanoate-CoA ligase [Aureococcus anophagefferens]|nr:decanoate-CoA ligase [Aureococcus anophagefferens]